MRIFSRPRFLYDLLRGVLVLLMGGVSVFNAHGALVTDYEDPDEEKIEQELRDAFRLYDMHTNQIKLSPALQKILDEVDKGLSEEELAIMLE